MLNSRCYGLRFRIIAWVLPAKQLDCPRTASPETRGGISNDYPRAPSNQSAKPRYANATQKRRFKPGSVLKKSRSDHKIRASANPAKKTRDIARIMLSIAVDLYINIVTKRFGVFMASLNSSAYTQVLRKIKDIKPLIAAYLKCIVGRPIVNDNVVIAAGNDLLNSRDNIFLLVSVDRAASARLP